MNQTTVTILCVFLSSTLSTIGATYQTNKSNDKKEQESLVKITTEFTGVQNAVTNFSSQLSTLTGDSRELKVKVESLEEFEREAKTRLRQLEQKVR